MSSDQHWDASGLCDPFAHRIEMPRWKWWRTYIFTVLLMPPRLLALMCVVFLAWIVCSIGMIGLSDEDLRSKPIRGWRRQFQFVGGSLGRFAFKLLSFHHVTVKGVQADAEEAPILVVAPHSTFLDGFVVFWCRVPYIVSRIENKKLPLLSKCVEFTQAIYVSREDPQSRQNTIKEIIRRSEPPSAGQPIWPQLIIFPEGSCSNRKALMTFKPGAFIPGKPVQPVLIRYPNQTDTVTWTWKQPHGVKTIVWLTATQLFSRAEIEFLPVYWPTAEEVRDPKLYARNVRATMAEALQVPTSDLTFEEIKQRYGVYYKNKKADLKTE